MEELSDLELMALVLGPGNSQVRALERALALLRDAESVSRLSKASYEELRQLGLSHKRALSLRASGLLYQRSRQVRLLPGKPFQSSVEVFRHFEPMLRHLKKESFWTLLLDGKNRITRIAKISEGSLTASLAHPREVYRPAIAGAAAGVLFVHNHPSGDPEPSEEDLRLTKRLVETGRIIGIRILDHVIIGRRRYFSFADQGLL
jgi:DNA repair protein RadC